MLFIFGPAHEGAFRKANLKVERAGGRDMTGLNSQVFQALPAVRPASAGRIGVAPAARLATAAPGGFGSPSAGTDETGRPLAGLNVAGRAGRNARAGDSQKSARVTEATVLEPKAATMERRRASALSPERAPPQGGNKVRLSALRPLALDSARDTRKDHAMTSP